MSRFAVMEQVWPPSGSTDRFRIVEHIITSDGIKTRLTSYSFQSLDEAKKFISEKENH